MNFKTLRWLLMGLLIGAVSYWIVQRRLQLNPTLAEVQTPGAATIPHVQDETEPTGTQRSVSQSSPAASEEQWRGFLKKMDSGSPWTLSRDERGRVNVVADGSVQLPKDGLKNSFDWAKKIAEFSGVPPQQIVDRGEMLPETEVGRAYRYPQMLGGYEVYGAFVNVFERSSDGAIWYTSVELRDIGQPDLQPKISLAQAETNGLAELQRNFKDVRVLTRPSQPVIWPLGPGESELAWPFTYGFTAKAYDERELMISAISGKVLSQRRVLNH